MPSDKRYLVAGLGNPGTAYARTRHNIGFMVVDELAAAYSIALLKKKFDTDFGQGIIAGSNVILAKPMGFMNRSGPPLRRLADFFNVDIENVIIIHDDIDLDFNRIKIKANGGHGGHNGLRSIIEAFGDNGFSRIRMGIGRPGERIDMTAYVLGQFSADENKLLGELIKLAADAVDVIISKGITAGMNKYN
ncbi:MAG: aminoacyl-tRNA hydrolase [Proteobacteria bacterium]|nr:aminoacyl-tRNA hydrolase [Pseudomonadota bacterium]